MNTTPDEKLDKALDRLPRSIEPEHDLWPGIAARIATQRSRRWPRTLWSYAGAVAAVTVIAVSILRVTAPDPAPRSDDSMYAITVPAPQGPADDTPRNLFAAQLASNHNLPPRAQQALLNNMRLLDDSIRRTQAALKKYPNDVNLQALLFNLYEQEAQLMNEAQQAQIQTTVRNTL